MKGEKRREEILSLIGNTDNPIPANVLKERFKVSRQVIVQDIAVLRAGGFDITSTNRGYVLGRTARASRVFKCRHSFDEIVDEGVLVIELSRFGGFEAFDECDGRLSLPHYNRGNRGGFRRDRAGVAGERFFD